MKFRTLLIIAIYCCFVATSFAQTRDVVTDVFSSQLDSLVEASLPQGSHVGIYIGGGQMIHAPKPGDVVKVAAVYGSPWYRRCW